MNVEIGAEAAQFPEKEYINGIGVAVHGVCPLVLIGTPPPSPLPPASVSSWTKGGTHTPAGEGGGSPNSDDWRKSLALYSVPS
jgi:hypothetical protein